MRHTVQKTLAETYRRHAHPAIRTAVAQIRARGTRATRHPDLVTIIIPMYNVELYIAECLDSILGQTYATLEVLIVDDGSPDGSYKVAKSYAEHDPRVRIIRQPNRGLGGARNTGISEATGRYLFFMDSDDTLPLDAIELLVQSLRSSGSDFAIGAPVRLERGRTWQAGWVKEVHAADRHGLTLDEFPEILKDVFATNKLFEAAFFRRVVHGFPERIRYEDQEPTAKAYVAGTFDVLAAPVYYWRVRDDGSSITQQKSNPDDLHDRLKVKNRVASVIAAGAAPKTHDVWLAKAIGFDLRGYYEQVPRTDRAYFDQLREGVKALATRLSPETWQLVSMIDRIPALATLAGRPDDVTLAVTKRDEYGWFFPTEVRDGDVYLDPTYVGELCTDFTDDQLRVGRPDLRAITKATALWWDGSTLNIEGHAFLTNVPYDETSTTSATLVSEDGVRVALPVQRRRDEFLSVETADAWNDHSESGFALAIDPTALPLGAEGPWRLEIRVTASGVSQTAILRDRDTRGIAGSRPVAAALGKVRWMASFEDGNCFTLRHTTELGSPVTSVLPDRAGISLTVDDRQATMLRLTSRSLGRAVEIKGKRSKGGTTTFRVSVPELLPTDDLTVEHVWSIRAHGGSKAPRRLTYYGSSDDLYQESPQHGRLRATMTRAGTLRLAQNSWWAIAEDIQLNDETMAVSGHISALGAVKFEARMVNESQVIRADRVNVDQATGRFHVRFPFNLNGRAPTTRQGFSVRLSVSLAGVRQERWLSVSDTLQRSFPFEADSARYGVTMTRTKRAGALWVRFRSRYTDNERGRFAQRQLHEKYHTPTAEGGGLEPTLRHAALFESYNGRGISDSVLAIYNELTARETDLERFWTVTDLNSEVPAGATPLLIHSEDWINALHNSRYLINNNNFPFYYRKRAGQTYIQTWHGTPLKRIGNHVPAANLSLPYRQLMLREADYWDALIAQNDFAAETLPSAFGYSGTVLNVGYPRNDDLAAADSALRRKKVRASLGLSEGQMAVLYAPTWRDNMSVSTGYARVTYLDFHMARSALGKDSKILLRGHSNTAHYQASVPHGVIDVTNMPDVNDLILASDLLITDYSSLMFDYCVTGKPILYLTPDLDEYRDVVRGFYLDLKEIAPGPMCEDNQSLAMALQELDRVERDYTERYRRFVRTFAPRDDGQAARRVVDAVFGVTDVKSPQTQLPTSVAQQL